ncbi:hypothetical protein ACQ4PT_046600 [Festuca glaucescens]
MVQPPSEEAVVDIHLKPWDLRLITIDYIQKGILLPKPLAGGVVDTLAFSFALFGKTSSTIGEILNKGLGWTAWQLNRSVASFDETTMKEWLDRWIREPDFQYMGNLSSGGAALMTGSSPRFDVFGNDFGWGKPVAVRSGPGDKVDGKATVFEGPQQGGSMSLEVCIAPDALARLVADEEFMETISMPM